MFQYSKYFSKHPKIKIGLKEVIKRLEPDLDRQSKAINEVKLFVDDQGEFGSALTKKAINQYLPGLPPNEEGRETVHEDGGATNRRVGRHTNNATQERDIDSCRKGKAPRTISSSSSSDDGDNGGSRRGGGTSGGSRGVGGIGEGIRGDGSTGGGYRDIQILEHELVIPMDMINLLVAVALLIEVLDTINMVLIPNNL
ncbi:hypothetical protein CK203_022941 [Vitis vinifera]|uniref:Uncharacterized protein n=1 Tax=Vitis vinifera TaxID=29760 RepID=A0A438J4B5_VITVI|nr:hypothetical protein CK203_022941 [Vitis vinifera]